MSFNLLPQEIASVTLSELSVIDLIRLRRVSIQWKKIIESTTHIKTTVEIQGDILNYFPNLESYDGPLENLRDMVLKPDSKLLSLQLSSTDGLSALSFYFGIIRDYYRAKLALSLEAELVISRPPTQSMSIPFDQGMITFEKPFPAFLHSYFGLIGKETEMRIMKDGPFGNLRVKRLIFHAAQSKMGDRHLLNLLTNENIKQLTVHVSQQQYDTMKDINPKVTFIVDKIDPPPPSKDKISLANLLTGRRYGRPPLKHVEHEPDNGSDESGLDE